MKIKGLCLGQFLTSTSSPFWYESGQIHFFSDSPLRFLSVFRCFGTKSVANCNSREKIKLVLGNINGLNDAFSLYEKMARMRPFPKYSAAICLFKDICNLGIPVDEYTMSIAINSYCLSNRVDFGFSVLGWFFKRGCVPDAFTFSTLLKGLRLCKLNVVTYGTVIDGLCKAGNTAMAIELLRVMEKGVMIDCKIYPNLLTFNSLIDAFCKEGLVDEAKDVLRIMMQKNVVPDVVSYNSLMDGYCLQGQLDEARNVFDSMASKNITPDIRSFNILINGYCRNMKIDDAMHLFHEMPRKGLKPNVVTYSSLLQGLFRGGKCSSALKLFDELQAAGLKPDFYTFCNLLDGLCKNGHAERALLFIIMDGFCKAKKLHLAQAIFSDLPTKGLEPNVVTYNILIKGCSKFLEEMGAKGFSPNSSTFALLLDLLGKEDNPTLLEMIQKLAPSTLKNKN
ncbi:hypothetical protein Pfo_015469 [Paulownia fortunei]|nr:hypothetical protein Pfo_015469 [Paulownia fortunei]